MAAPMKRRTLLQMISSLPALPLTGLLGLGMTAMTRSNPARAGTDRSVAWLSGGTDKIRVEYPDDRIFDQGNTCPLALTEPTTKGPCYFMDETGEDISLGLKGLPMQMCLRLIDSDCQLLAGHTVEVWHCDTRGVYSGDTRGSQDARRFRVRACTRGDRAAHLSSWYRGKLVTNRNGRVNFKSCFPGWYPGRTIHVHFAVSDERGQNRVISQFGFPDALAWEICTTHERYQDRGAQDTPFEGGGDVVFPARGYEPFVCATRQNPDGSLLAWHTIQVV